MELTAYFTRSGTHLNFDRKTGGLEFISLGAGLTVPNENDDGHTLTSKAWVPSVLVPVSPQNEDQFLHLFTKGMRCEITPIDDKHS